MKVQVHGPNLYDQREGVFDVHAAGCRDIGHNGGETTKEPEEYDTFQQLVEDYMGDVMADNEGSTWLHYKREFHVYPCAKALFEEAT